MAMPLASMPPSEIDDNSLHKPPPKRSPWQRFRWLILGLSLLILALVIGLAVGLTVGRNHTTPDLSSNAPPEATSPSVSSPGNPVSGSDTTVGSRPVSGSPDLRKLDYATYRGVVAATNISVWLGMRFAAPPTGSLRFQAPADPVDQGSDVIAANKFGPACLAVNGGAPTDKHAEDCLYVNVFAPASANETSKLPVFFFLQGGGFSSNASPYLDGTSLIKAANNSIVVVTSNYRVGPYGFLAAQEVASKGSLNNGLKDQRKAMEWTKKYISMFGGDPDHIVLGGGSAGGQSVALHMTAYGAPGKPLFAAAAAESVSSPMLLDVNGSQFIYDALAQRAKCKGDTFACLSNLPAAQLQTLNTRVKSAEAEGLPVYSYSPTVDGDFVPDYTYNLFNAGRFYKVPTIMGDDQNGGTSFAPTHANSYNDTDTFLRNNFQRLTNQNLDQINALYPIGDFPERFAGMGAFYRQASQAYGDMRYKCPGLHFSTAIAAAGAPSWAYRYAVVDPRQQALGLGTPHVVEVGAIWGAENGAPASYHPGEANADIVPEMQAYWTSFVRSLDPNAHRRRQDPEWTAWNATGRRMMNLVTHQSSMLRQSDTEGRQCGFFESIGPAMHQ